MEAVGKFGPEGITSGVCHIFVVGEDLQSFFFLSILSDRI